MRRTKKIVLILVLGMLSVFICCLVFKGKRKIEISSETIGYLKSLKVDDFDVTYNDKSKEVKSVAQKEIIVTNDEIKEYIENELSLAGDFIEIKDRDIVQEGDFIKMSCSVFVEGKLVNKLEQEVLKVGAGYYGKEFEEKLVGVHKNKKTKLEITVPENEEKYAGKIEQIEVRVTKIQYKEEKKLTNEYVKENYEGLKNVDEYYKYVKQKITDEKMLEQQKEIRENIKRQLTNIYWVKIDEKQKAYYAEKKYDEYCEMAKEMGSTLEEFSSTMYGESKKQFLDRCFEEAVNELETIILFGVLAKNKNIHVEERDVEAYINSCEESVNNYENKEDYYDYVRYRLMENKVIQLYER